MLASLSPLLGVMKFERDPISLENWDYVWQSLVTWVQDTGGFAMLGLALWMLNGLLNPVYDVRADGTKRNRLVGPGMIGLAAIALTIYLVSLGILLLLSYQTEAEVIAARAGKRLSRMEWAFEISLAVAGAVALIGFVGPFFLDLIGIPKRKVRWSRIFAIAKLSYKEAVRRKIVWVFLAILLVYLFPARWFFREKPEDELKTVVSQTTRGMNLLLISVGMLLAAFSIPGDIKNLTIQTIVTKPVERIEIILGRFLGYLGLLTAALLVMTAGGLALINFGNISLEAEEESMKSRVAAYGDLGFSSRKTADFTGVDVGREDSYRKYIAGHPNSTQRAIWNFPTLAKSFGVGDEPIPLEFAFDIYRTTKGVEGAGVAITFEILTHQWNPANEDEYSAAVQGLTNVKPGDPNWAKVDKLAETYGRYVWRNQNIFDYHTSAIAVPAGLFRNALAGEPKLEGAGTGRFGQRQRPPRLQVQIKCETPSQFVGAARYDLYFLESEGNFSFNYFKGAAGVWFRLVIAITVAVACSTYLSGVLAFLVALFVFVSGFFLKFIYDTANAMNAGGGPLESLARLFKNTVATAELDGTPTVRAAQFGDLLFRWALRRVMNIFPDVQSYGMSEYVAQGFNIGLDFLLLNLVMLVGYVLPWLVAAYYLMKAREIAA